MDTWILQMVRARSLRRVVAWAATLAFVALFAFGQIRYIRNFLAGPYVLGAAELDAIPDAAKASRYFVRVTGSKTIDTGVQQITVKKRRGVETGREVSAGYYALVVGEKFLICKGGIASGSQLTFEGELSPLPPELEARLFNSKDMQAARGRFYPYYVDNDSFRLPGYIAIGVFLVLAAFAVTKGLPAWKHFQDPESHPIVERVQGWGDPIGIAVAAEREARRPRYKGGNGWSITDQFLVQSTFFTFDILRVADLLWAYKKVTKHSVNFIPTGKTYEAVIHCYGGGATVQGNEKVTDEVLGFVAQRAPWAIFGYSQELETAFTKNTQSFCVAVEKRKLDRAQAARAPAAGTTSK